MSSRRDFVKSAAACVTGLALTHRAEAAASPGIASASASESLRFKVPAGAWDCQVHVIGPRDKYPMLPNRAYTPPEANVLDLQAHLSSLDMSHVVLVQPSVYGTDNRYMVEALAELGQVARGVAVIDRNTTDGEMKMLTEQGVRAARINLESIGAHDPEVARRALGELAGRVAPLGWHIQIYASLQVIAAVADRIAKLAVPVVLDHFAMAQAGTDLRQADLHAVLSLVSGGQAYVKLSAPYRVSKAAPAYEDVRPLALAYIKANPERIIWASDWPHTDRVPGIAPTEVSPFRKTDDIATLGLLASWAPSEELRRKILVDNPARLYAF